jgi:hypothetical protein
MTVTFRTRPSSLGCGGRVSRELIERAKRPTYGSTRIGDDTTLGVAERTASPDNPTHAMASLLT